MTPQIKQRIEQIQRGKVPQGYKKTKVGIVPEKWKKTNLGQLFKERNEIKCDSLQLLSITADKGIVPRTELDEKDNSSEDKSKYKHICVGDIGYNTMRMWQGISALSSYEGIVSPAYTVLVPNKNIDANYFSFLFKSKRQINMFYRNSQGLVDDTRSLKYKWFKIIEAVIPTLDEQKKIAEVLACQDKIIELNKRKVEELKKLKKAYLSKMFPKKGYDVPELRFKGFTDPWEQRKLGEVADTFEYGLNASAKEFDGINKYIRITDIDDKSRMFLTDDITSPDTDLKLADKYKLEKGDILFARTGASVGKTYLYREKDGLIYYAGFLIRAKINSKNDAEFVFQNTLTDAYDSFIKITSQRSGQPGVNAQEYQGYTFYAPKLEEQQKIGAYFHNLDNLITLHQRKVEELQNEKEALMQLLLTGIVRV